MRVFLRNNSSTFWLINALFDAETILSCAKPRLQALTRDYKIVSITFLSFESSGGCVKTE